MRNGTFGSGRDGSYPPQRVGTTSRRQVKGELGVKVVMVVVVTFDRSHFIGQRQEFPNGFWGFSTYNEQIDSSMLKDTYTTYMSQ